jgi:hypothetical protein
MLKYTAAAFALFFVGCSSIVVEPYTPTDLTKETLAKVRGSYSAGSVSGQTRVESDQLLKSSLPCRLETFKMPADEPVALYIENALRSELQATDKGAASGGRRIDIVVVKLESDTSKIRNGRWSLDFQYKTGRITREIQTATEYSFDADSSAACQNTADAFDDALRTNFEKFFKTLH